MVGRFLQSWRIEAGRGQGQGLVWAQRETGIDSPTSEKVQGLRKGERESRGTRQGKGLGGTHRRTQRGQAGATTLAWDMWLNGWTTDGRRGAGWRANPESPVLETFSWLTLDTTCYRAFAASAGHSRHRFFFVCLFVLVLDFSSQLYNIYFHNIFQWL